MIFIILLLSSLAILSCWKWYKWRLTALTITLIMTEKYREPTNEEIHYYAGVAIKKIFKINY